MKIENLCEYAVQLGDGRMIGAAGAAESVREYFAKELTDADKERVSRKLLRVVPEAAPVTATDPTVRTNDKKGDK